jgi:hypothetical protein
MLVSGEPSLIDREEWFYFLSLFDSVDVFSWRKRGLWEDCPFVFSSRAVGVSAIPLVLQLSCSLHSVKHFCILSEKYSEYLAGMPHGRFYRDRLQVFAASCSLLVV